MKISKAHITHRLTALLLVAAVMLSLVPSAFAAQQNSYHDPAEHWLTANDRTNELDVNAVVTHETFHCAVCEKKTIFTMWRTPEYTQDGVTALSRNVLYSDGTMVDGEGKGYILDGFPRTIPQAEALDKALAGKGEKMDYAVDVDVPDENIISRMSGRRACTGCGATYHIVYNPSQKGDNCQVCGEALILRDDDKPETVQKRLSVYHEQTQPLIEYYQGKGILKTVDGTKNMDEVFEEILGILK